MEEVSGAAAQVRYTYGNTLVSQTRNASGAPATSFYGYDAHGNVSFLADGTGAVTDTYVYDAWGNLLGQSGATPNTRLYAGEEFDPDLGLINLWARYYKPEVGRFGVADFLDSGPRRSPISSNRYLYANGEPVGQKDPLGLDAGIDYGLLTATGPSRAFLAVTAAAGGTVGAAGVVLGNKVACEFEDAADTSAALQGEEDVVRVDPACPKFTCDCSVPVEFGPREILRAQVIPRKVKGRGQGDTETSAKVRCYANARKNLGEHPQNSGDYEGTLRPGDCEIKVCFENY